MISIIIPAYNAERYIKRTLNSIICQYEGSFEIIVINDGSKDKTLEILNQYKNVEYIKIINKENTGVSDTRNIGLKVASGDLIMFCDADDEYDNKLINYIKEDFKQIENLEYIAFGRIDINGKKNRLCNDHKELKIYDTYNAFVLQKFCTGKPTFSVCNKVYLSKIIKENNIQFNTNLKFCEDLDFNLQYLKYCKKIIEDYRVNYIRYCNNDSTVYKAIPNYLEKNINIIDEISKREKKYDKKVYKKLINHILIVDLNRLFSGIDNNNSNYKIFKKECKKVYKYLIKYEIDMDFEKNVRNILFFRLFKLRMFLILYFVSVKFGNVIRKGRK